MEVRDEIKKKGNWRQFLRLIQDTKPRKGFLFCVINEFAFYRSKFIYSDVNKGLVDNFHFPQLVQDKLLD